MPDGKGCVRKYSTQCILVGFEALTSIIIVQCFPLIVMINTVPPEFLNQGGSLVTGTGKHVLMSLLLIGVGLICVALASADEQRWPETEIVFFGGDDGAGNAFAGGVWDWDTIVSDPWQGWHEYRSGGLIELYFGRVTTDDFVTHGDPVIPANADPGMIWCGIHEDEAIARGFPTGMGYQDEMDQWAWSPQFALVPSPEANEITIEFLYTLDMELDYDFVTCSLICYDNSELLIGSVLVEAMTGIAGSPAEMVPYTTTVPYTSLPPATGFLQLAFNYTSDGGYSDEDGHYDCYCGPFSADNVAVTMGEVSHLWRFNSDDDGWSFGLEDPVNQVMGVQPEDVWSDWLLAAGMSEWTLSGNAWDFIDELGSPWTPPGVPEETTQTGVSGIIIRGDLDADETIVQWDAYLNGYGAGTWIRPGFLVYPDPFGSPGEPAWSDRMGQDSWYLMTNPGWSGQMVHNLTTLDGGAGVAMPADWDSMRFAFEVLCTDAFQGAPIIDLGNTKGAPLLDNVRVGLVDFNTQDVANDDASVTIPGGVRILAITNPVSRNAEIRFTLARPTELVVSIFETTGRQVRRVTWGLQSAGEHQFVWDGRNQNGIPVAAGVYHIRLQSPDCGAADKRITLLR
jgi:FlgD Ig-like domain